MKFMLTTLITIVISISFSNPQSVTSYTNETLKEIYEKISYRTPAFSEVQERWKITDLDLIRDIINKLYNNSSLKRKNGVIVNSDSVMKEYAKKIQDNQISIVCVKRYYDDQLDSLIFLTPEVLALEPLSDWLEMNQSLSIYTYDRIKSKNYTYVDFTNKDFVEPNNDSYTIFSLFQSEIFLISFGAESKVIISPYYQLGYDNINLPSWYKGSINYGVKFKLFPSSGLNNINYKKFSISIGVESPQNFSVSNSSQGIMNTMFRERLLYGTTDNIFIGISYSPSKSDIKPLKWAAELAESEKEFAQLSAEFTLPFNKKDKHSLMLGNVDNFYSIRNHWSINGKLCNKWNFFDLGLSISGYNIANYTTHSDKSDLSTLSFKHHFLFGMETGISREDAPFYYSFSPQLSFDFSNGQKFFVIKSQLMFFRSFGIDFKFFKSLNGKNTAPWHYQDYLVISPIIMIN